MNKLVNSEYRFTTKINDEREIGLTVYIDYNRKTYDIVQDGEEGIFPRNHNFDTGTNKAFMQLAIEALNFIETELFTD